MTAPSPESEEGRAVPGPLLVDTSVIVRYLTDDPPPMAAQAAEIIDGDAAITLSELALVETAHVLESVYRAPRDEVVAALVGLVQRRNISMLLLPKQLVLEALEMCRGSRRCSFTDAILWAEAMHVGAEQVLTFDQRFPSRGMKVGMDLAP